MHDVDSTRCPARCKTNLLSLDLPPSARLLAQALEKYAYGHDECWVGNARLVAVLKVCERTVRNGLAWLRRAGLIRIVRDYTRRSRRRVILLWRSPPLLSGLPANSAGHSAVDFAARPSPPPHPPNRKELNKDDRLTGAGCAGSSSSLPEEDANVVKAEKIFGSHPWVRRKVRAALVKAGGKALDVALAWAERRRARHWSYVASALRNMEAEGGPGEPPGAAGTVPPAASPAPGGRNRPPLAPVPPLHVARPPAPADLTPEQATEALRAVRDGRYREPEPDEPGRAEALAALRAKLGSRPREGVPAPPAPPTPCRGVAGPGKIPPMSEIFPHREFSSGGPDGGTGLDGGGADSPGDGGHPAYPGVQEFLESPEFREGVEGLSGEDL